MRIDCPHCGRQGHLPDGKPLPSIVRCPQCQNKFNPVPVPAFQLSAFTPFCVDRTDLRALDSDMDIALHFPRNIIKKSSDSGGRRGACVLSKFQASIGVCRLHDLKMSGLTLIRFSEAKAVGARCLRATPPSVLTAIRRRPTPT